MDIPKLKVPNSDLNFSRIGFGCEQLGLHNWGKIDLKSVEYAINFSLETGINYFDTADVYGMGKSEENLGNILGNNRKKVNIITKFGIRIENGNKIIDNSSKWITKAIENSLSRLKSDYIDLYQLHYWDGCTTFDEIYEILNKLKNQGKIRAFGFSNIPHKNLEINNNFFLESSIFSYEFSLANKQNKPIIDSLQNELLFLAYGGLGQGILSGKYDENTQFPNDDRRSLERYTNFKGDKLKQNLKIVSHLRGLSFKYNVTVSTVALQFILQNIPKCSIISGIKSVSQIKDNLQVFEFSLTNDEVEQLIKLSYE